MFKGSYEQRLLVVSLLAALSVSACGKKKDVLSSPSKEASTQKQTEEAPKESKDVPVLEGAPGGPLPPVAQTQPVNSTDLNPIPLDYIPSDASHLEKEGLTKKITGGQTKEGLLYTSNSADSIHALLRARNEKVSPIQKKANLELAASVQKARMMVDSLSGEASVVIKMTEGSEESTYVLAGSMGEGSAQALKLVRASGDHKTTGKLAMEGTIKCLDLDGQCENTFARLVVKSSSSAGVLNIIFRQSDADLYFHLPGEYSENSEYIVMREFIHNSIKRVSTDNRIRSIKLNSWEVVNGRSGFELLIKGRNKELLGFAGPLLAPEAGTAVNIPLARIGKDSQDSLDLINLDSSSLNLANTIQTARLVNNNGLGQIRIALKMRKRGEWAQDQFAMTVMRKVKPLIDLTEESMK